MAASEMLLLEEEAEAFYIRVWNEQGFAVPILAVVLGVWPGCDSCRHLYTSETLL